MDFRLPTPLSTQPTPTPHPLTSDAVRLSLAATQAVEASMPSADQVVMETLHSVRTLLNMQVAFVSEFKNGRRFFRYIDTDWAEVPICVGGSNPLDESYCQRVVDGRLPEVMQNACEVPEALTLPATQALPVGAHLSVPIRFSDGHVFGTYCCFSTYPDYTLSERDARILRLFADMVGKVIERQVTEQAARDALVLRLRTTLDKDDFICVYQPIVNLRNGRPIGFEALTRFGRDTVPHPDRWFNDAAQVGLQEELELAAIRKALHGLEHLPPNTYVSLNAAPSTILQGKLSALLEGYPCERLMLEVTEHVSIEDYSVVADALEPLRRRGIRLAVDDAGSGYASFRHILKLKPDVIKLDISLIQRIDCDPGSRALAAALIRFAEETGSQIVAEGVETEAELAVLRELKVDKVQGFLLGRPAPLEMLAVRASG